MKMILKSMAVCVMDLFLLIAVSAGLSGCGAAVYESIAESAANIEESPGLSEFTAESGASDAEQESGGEALLSESTPMIYVYVCGAVLHPGVYELPNGARVFQAIAAAGGLDREADLKAINQAALLLDGQQLTVLTYEETELAGGGTSVGTGETPDTSKGGADLDGRININTADVSELMQLSGIGEKRAQDIIAYREANGPFSSIEEIMNVSGIKTAVFERIRDEIVAAG